MFAITCMSFGNLNWACSFWQLLAGLSEPTSGSICIQRYGNDGNPCQPSEPLPPEKVGIVFQFPERYPIVISLVSHIS